jgi:hypothetical protein
MDPRTQGLKDGFRAHAEILMITEKESKRANTQLSSSNYTTYFPYPMIQPHLIS